MKIKTLGWVAFFATTFGAATVAQAAPVIFFGENQTPGGLVVGAPLTAHDAFVAAITGDGVENFELFANETSAPLALVFAGSTITAQLTATGTGADTVFDTPFNGRFNTTSGGDSFFETDSGAVAIAFSSPISAFGFYGTDMGEASQVLIALTDVNNVVTNFTVNNSIHGANGALLFWGFTDTSNTYQSVTFSNNNPSTASPDTAGFDDMIIGVATTTVPEPATLALLGLGLAGLGFSRPKQ